MGLLRGKQTEPVERTATAGFITLSVAPYGYTKVRALPSVHNHKECLFRNGTLMKYTRLEIRLEHFIHPPGEIEA